MGMSQTDDNFAEAISKGLTEQILEFENSLIFSNKLTSLPAQTDDENPDVLDENWRYPELNEVIVDICSPDDDVKLNAAAYLQHLSFRNDNVKTFARQLNAFKPLLEMLIHTNHEVVKSALGALRNLSCGKANDLNKVEIMKNNGIRVLVDLLRISNNHMVIELTSGILWNLSSCSMLKDEILQCSLDVLFNFIIMPIICCISPDTCQPAHKLNFTNFRHATGVIRNLSSGGRESRTKLQQHGGLTSSLLTFITWSRKHKNVDEKSIENCLCALRNISHNMKVQCRSNFRRRCMSVGRSEDGYKNFIMSPSASCLKKKKVTKSKEVIKEQPMEENEWLLSETCVVKLLLKGEVIAVLLHLLNVYSNNVDLCEAILGIIQNVCNIDIHTSVDVREIVRKCRGLPTIICNLTMLSDKVVLASASLLKLLTTDHVNQEAFGKLLMEHLLNRSPPCYKEHSYPNHVHTVVQNVIFDCIGLNLSFARNVLVTGGVKQLTNVVLSPASFGIRAGQLAAIILLKIWSFSELHSEIEIRGLKKNDFMAEFPRIESTECLVNFVGQFEGRSKKVRFSAACSDDCSIETPSKMEILGPSNLRRSSLPFSVIFHSSKTVQSPYSTCLLFPSSAISRQCLSASLTSPKMHLTSRSIKSTQLCPSKVASSVSLSSFDSMNYSHQARKSNTSSFSINHFPSQLVVTSSISHSSSLISLAKSSPAVDLSLTSTESSKLIIKGVRIADSTSLISTNPQLILLLSSPSESVHVSSPVPSVDNAKSEQKKASVSINSWV